MERRRVSQVMAEVMVAVMLASTLVAATATATATVNATGCGTGCGAGPGRPVATAAAAPTRPSPGVVRLDAGVEMVTAVVDVGQMVVYVATVNQNIVPVELDTQTTRAPLPVGFAIGSLAIAEDGASLYVGARDQNVIRQISTANGAVLATIDLGSTASLPVTPLVAVDIAVQPDHLNGIAVALQAFDDPLDDAHGVAFFQDGVRAAAFVQVRVDHSSLRFSRSTPTRLFHNSSISRRFTRLAVAAGGVTQDPLAPAPAPDGGLHPKFVVVDGRIYLSDGTVLDEALAPLLRYPIEDGADFAVVPEFDGDRVLAFAADASHYDAYHRTSGKLLDSRTFPAAGARPAVLGAASLGEGLVVTWGDQYVTLFDLDAVFDPGGDYHALMPQRILDTRSGLGTGRGAGPIGPGATLTVAINGRGGVPSSGVSAVVVNTTATEPTAPSYLTIWASDLARPTMSNLNFVPGQTVPNLVTADVGGDGSLTIFNERGAVQVVMDVVGYYASSSGEPGSRYHDLSLPRRLLDTRGAMASGGGALGPSSTMDLDVVGNGSTGVPQGTTAVVLNVTVTNPTAWSYLTVFPGDVAAPPETSNLNYVPGLTVPNMVVVRVPSNGVITFFNAFGTVDLLVDLIGFYGTEREGYIGQFVAFAPERILDTRLAGLLPALGPVAPYDTLLLPVDDQDPFASYLFNVTVTGPTRAGYMVVFPLRAGGRPDVSNLNFAAGVTTANAVVAGTSSTPEIEFFNGSDGTVHLIVDVFGGFLEE